MTTINKAMGFDFNKKELGLRSEKKSEITHSLDETENDRPRFGRWLQNQITIAKACGYRRVSIIWITPTTVGNSQRQMIVRVVAKVGKERVHFFLSHI